MDNQTSFYYYLDDDNETIRQMDNLTFTLATFTWWYAVVMACVGTVFNTCGALYLITRASRCSSFPCLICIVFADLAFLLAVFFSLVVAHAFPTVSGAAVCKLMIFVTNASSLFSNWCWVLLWSGRYVAIFHPWLYFRYRYMKTRWILPGLLVVCVVSESWTLVFATETQKTCDLDERLATYATFKYVFLLDALVTFFLPFLLIAAADVSVFAHAYYTKKTSLEQMESNELSSKQSSPKKFRVDAVMIVSSKYRQNARACKHRMIRRFVVLASLDLMLNFPNVVINVMEAFNRDNKLFYPISYLTVAISYSLFYLQYVFNVVHIRMLVDDYSRRESSEKSRSLISYQQRRLVASKSI